MDKNNVHQPNILVSTSLTVPNDEISSDQCQKSTPRDEVYHQQHLGDTCMRSDVVGDTLQADPSTSSSSATTLTFYPRRSTQPSHSFIETCLSPLKSGLKDCYNDFPYEQEKWR